MGFLVFARFQTPIEAFGRYTLLACQVPIVLRGKLTGTVAVSPGDFIFADVDGVLVIPKDLTLRVLEDCERIKGVEDIARTEFARGDDPVEVFQRHKRLERRTTPCLLLSQEGSRFVRKVPCRHGDRGLGGGGGNQPGDHWAKSKLAFRRMSRKDGLPAHLDSQRFLSVTPSPAPSM